MNADGNDSAVDDMALFPIPPPTQQPSDLELLLTLVHLVCLTSTLCGNVSQIVLQLYTHRHREGYPVQHMLSLLFAINVVVSLGIPWLIVETLVRYWTFGRTACRTFQGTTHAGRALIPYVVASIYVLISLALAPMRLKVSLGVAARFFVAVLSALFFAFVVPVILGAQVVSELQEGDGQTVVFETFHCEVRPTTSTASGVRFIAEFVVPLCACVVFAARLKRDLRSNTFMWNALDGCTYQLAIISTAHFAANFFHYLSESVQSWLFGFLPKTLDAADVVVLLPYISSAVTWIPAANLSSALSVVQLRDVPASGSSSSCRVVRLLVQSQSERNSSCPQATSTNEPNRPASGSF